MKHLKKFNESESTKYKMELKDYFYDFSDNGFTIVVDDNMVTGKYTGEYDFDEVFEMYQDAITKLKIYFAGITRTSFDYKRSVVNFKIEVKNNILDVDSIEVVTTASTLRGKLNLKPSRYSISLLDVNRVREIVLFCKDENNRSYNITWVTKQSLNGTGPNYLEKGYTVVKIANSNVKIDLENATKIYDMISKNVIPFFMPYVGSLEYTENCKNAFLKTEPELLEKS